MKKNISQVGIWLSIACLIAVTGCSTGSSTKNSVRSLISGEPVTVFSLPVTGGGILPPCPGIYSGYVNYTKTVAQGWGWMPSTNTTSTFTAADGSGRTDTKIMYSGKYGDTGCGQITVTVPNPPISPEYRFTIYFPKDVPTTNYPIILSGFNP